MQMYTGTRLTTAIHRRLLSRFFLREGGRLYTGYLSLTDNFPCLNKDLHTYIHITLRASEFLQSEMLELF